MIQFDLDGAHPDYVPVITDAYLALDERWPQARLASVRTYHPKRGDRSRGNARNPGEIQLNLFWFAAAPEVLIAAGEAEGSVPRAALGHDIDLPWHGGISQPGQILTHEYGHILIQRLGERICKLLRAMWEEITADPSLASSGYSLTDESECGAELFTGVEFSNPRRCQVVDEFAAFLTMAA